MRQRVLIAVLVEPSLQLLTLTPPTYLRFSPFHVSSYARNPAVARA